MPASGRDGIFGSIVMTTERANALNALTNLAVIIAIVGGAWALGGSMARLQAGVDGNAAAIQNNAAAIQKLQEAVAENGRAIAENKGAIERLSRQFDEHIRRHEVAGL